ncbi:hypothetical protein CLF_108631 [Clonorchis sinensis]|uniref:Endonuclease/exonuclease/phosphatase domain-containing protein n=1 Tax=Clonorchis sinensis TaxID=79923 RepID=G7YIA7_CLOSI|nr:hypothetical protein CLF_108631 [Clonorchis sinensis]
MHKPQSRKSGCLVARHLADLAACTREKNLVGGRSYSASSRTHVTLQSSMVHNRFGRNDCPSNVRRGMQCDTCKAWWHFKYMGLQDDQVSQLANSPDPFVCASCLYTEGAMHSQTKKKAIKTKPIPHYRITQASKVLGRAVSVQKANPTIRRLCEDRPLDARKLGHSSSREEMQKRLPDGVSSADPKLKAKPIVVIAHCAPEITPRQTTATPDSSFYSTTADPLNSKGVDALEEASLTWTERPNSTLSKVATLIVDTVVAQDHDSQSLKPDHGEPNSPSYTQLATLIAGDSDVHTGAKERRLQPNKPYTTRQIRKLLAGFKVQSSEKTSLMGAPPKELLGAATQRSKPHGDTIPTKSRQHAQEAKQTQDRPLSNSKPGRPKDVNERATSSNGRNFRPRGKNFVHQSLFNKLCDIKQSVCLEQPSIIALTETWLTPDVSYAEISIDGYSVFRADSKRGRAGGVALYLHAALPIPIVLSDTTPAPFCDALWLQVPLRGSDSPVLGVVYRNPSSPPEDDHFLIRTLGQLSSSYHFTHLLLVGDFNAPKAPWTELQRVGSSGPFAAASTEVVQQSAWTQHVVAPTRYRAGQQPSLLDLAITNERHFVDQVTINAPLGHRDHCVVSSPPRGLNSYLRPV